MTLEEHLLRNETLIADLRAALAAGDDHAGADLVAARAPALSALADALRDASPATRASVAARLRDLGQADSDLREAAATALERLDQARREGFGLPRRPASPATPPDTIPCLDRRA